VIAFAIAGRTRHVLSLIWLAVLLVAIPFVLGIW
jgi:hypothetical protein